MTAKQMFERLGYIKIKDHFSTIDYWKDRHEAIYSHIEFDLNNKTFSGTWWNESLAIDMPTLKAINKQCEELGWLE